MATVAMACIGVTLAAIPFAGTLSYSERAKSHADVAFDLPKLEAGKVVVLRVDGRPLFVLRPSEDQRKSIAGLDEHVWDARHTAYDAELGAYVYWGLSTRWGCELREKPQGTLRYYENQVKQRWSGGYWDPHCEVSYDYAGRAIRGIGYTFNGYAREVPNLAKPKFRVVGDKFDRVYLVNCKQRIELESEAHPAAHDISHTSFNGRWRARPFHPDCDDSEVGHLRLRRKWCRTNPG